MPHASEDQRRAMQAAAAGRSTIGIPQSVGREYTRADALRGGMQGRGGQPPMGRPGMQGRGGQPPMGRPGTQGRGGPRAPGMAGRGGRPQQPMRRAAPAQQRYGNYTEPSYGNMTEGGIHRTHWNKGQSYGGSNQGGGSIGSATS